MLSLIREFIEDESAATFTEYAVLVSVIAIAVIATVILLRTAINDAFQSFLNEWERIQRS